MIEFAVKTAVFGNHVSSIVQPAAILKCLRTTMRTGLCTITRCGRVPAACARQTVIKIVIYDFMMDAAGDKTAGTGGA